MKIVPIVVTSLLSCMTSAVNAANDAVPYPEGYRHWYHVKTMLIESGHPLENPFHGVHHVYANKLAENGLAKGRFTNGSVLVFDLLQYKQQDKAIQEGGRKLIGVMVKNDKKYAATGGWGFEGFSGNSKTERLTDDGGKSCFNCHEAQRENDYVYSRFRE